MSNPRPSRLFFWALIVLAAAGIAALAVSVAPAFGFDLSSGGSVRLVYLVAILLFVGTALVGRRLSGAEVVRAVFNWAMIFVVLIAAYAYRDELAGVGGRLLGVLAPGVPISGRLAGTADDSVVIVRAGDGHFAVRSSVNGVSMTLMVDTGASFVTLTPADAGAVGIDPARLDFVLPIQTANGAIRAAPITIDRLAVGGIERRNVKALVAPPGALHQSLLGLSFLNTLASYAISGDRLVLTP